MEPQSADQELAALEIELLHLREALLNAEAAHADEIAAAHPRHRRSAANLVHYVELRRHDVRDLQGRLAEFGLSSLGRSEGHVLATVEAVLAVLARLNGRSSPVHPIRVSVAEGTDLLAGNTSRLLGQERARRSTRIMVTLPSEAADDAELVARLAAEGMDVARVNCAHDTADRWAQMIAHVSATEAATGRRCLVAMDLGGPKLRTGPLEPGPEVVRVAPHRDRLGRVVAPATVRLVADAPPGRHSASTTIPVDDAAWLRRRGVGETIDVVDTRGARRRWVVASVDDDGCTVTVGETTYVATGLTLSVDAERSTDAVRVGELPMVEQSHRVSMGDRVILTRSLAPAAPTPAGVDHLIGCSLAEAFAASLPGERVWLDDGKIGGTIEAVTAERIVLIITDVRPGGANLKAGKGINLPDTALQLDALTAKDLEDLPFVARHADLVNLSFVRRPADVARLQRELERLGAPELGIVLKIENAVAFENLPGLLLRALRSPNVGVMIARGDLAVEIGFERLAEVQEEIMWICEAAHIPVIWATQVLDTLARTGQASRAEITDAAMGERAECVMLNKGPHIVDAIAALDSILGRMQRHQDKKRSLLRRLRSWDHEPTPA